MEIKAEKIKPSDPSAPKTGQVERMFDSIAPAYDLMNRAMTLGIDHLWRARAVREVAARKPREILDVATGTGDLAIRLARAAVGSRVTGIDLSEGMLDIGRSKVAEAGLADRVTFAKADCLALPYPDASFDAVTVAYGVRNFEHLDRGYSEMARVLRPGGMLCVIELSTPDGRLTRPLYDLYTLRVIPALGRLVASDKSAYTYLPASIAAMPQGEDMLRLMTDAGLSEPRLRRMTFGACTIYTAVKRH